MVGCIRFSFGSQVIKVWKGCPGGHSDAPLTATAIGRLLLIEEETYMLDPGSQVAAQPCDEETFRKCWQN